MNKAIILCGLPGSGKSTYCKEFQKSNLNYVRINRDDLRKMVNLPYNPILEKDVIRYTELKLVNTLHVTAYNPIIDDTNYNVKTLEMWFREFNALGIDNNNIIIVYFTTSIEECIRRDSKREESVGEQVIMNMFKNKEQIEEFIKDKQVIRI